MKKKAYYGSRISPNMTKTPEGFLICHNVPLARTGIQRYLGAEVNHPENDIVDVFRREEEVFAPATLASFEGKPVTNEHPVDFVQPENATGCTLGVAQNVRRGTGEDSDLMLCDLVIYDAVLISLIESGKREISAGYYCEYVPCDGGYEQTNIVGNHVAVVTSGRAGSRVAIKDNAIVKIDRGGQRMKKQKESIFHKMFSALVKDTETTPEEILEAADALNDSDEVDVKATDADEEVSQEEVTEAVKDALSPLLRRIQSIENQLRARDEEPDELEKIEDELSEELEVEDDEASVTIAPEDIETKDEDEEEDGDGQATADKAAALRFLRAMKPVIQSLPVHQRKKATDSLKRALKSYGKKRGNNSGYRDMLQRTSDSRTVNHATAFGEACRARNPHFKGNK